jgi:hypothetical protein
LQENFDMVRAVARSQPRVEAELQGGREAATDEGAGQADEHEIAEGRIV